MDLQQRTTTLFGAPTTKGQLYGGMYLLAGGVALGLLSLLLFFYSSSRSGGAYFAWREGALAVGAVALTCFFVGVSVALPSHRTMRIASYVGMGLCGLAIVLFLIHYPHHFNTGDKGPGHADYTGIDVSIFVVGLAGIVAGAFASVIGYYIERIQQARAAEDAELEHLRPDYKIPEWAIEKDLADADKRFGVEWGRGLVSGGKDFHEFQLGKHALDGGQIKGLGKERVVQVAATQVDAGEKAFKGMRKEKNALPGEWADQSAASLRAFRRKQQEAPKQFTPRIAWYLRVWDWITGRSRRGDT